MQSQSGAAATPRVLICDDEVTAVKDLVRTLKDLGYAVTGTAATGEEAIRAAGEVRPDLILMDIELPGEIDGIGAAEQIRGQMDVPILYLTVDTERDVFKRAKKTEPYGYVNKSAGVPEIEATIETALYRHEADKEVRASEARRAKAEELAGLHSWEWDIGTGHLLWSAESCSAFGIRPEDTELTLEALLNAVHARDRNLVQNALHEAVSGVGPFDLEFRVVLPNGQTRFMHSRAEIQRDTKGRPIRVYGMALDITDRKKAEEALKLEREKLISIFDSINEVISVIDAQTHRIVFVNKFMKHLHGDDLVGNLCYKALHGFDEPCEFCTKDIAFRLGGEPYRWDYHNPTSNRDYLSTDRIIKWTDGRDAKFHLGIDVTELRKTEEALRASQAQLANAVEMAHLGHWELDVTKGEFTFNDQFYKLFRTTADQVGGYTMSLDDYAHRFVHPDEISVVRNENRKAVETDDPYFCRELEHRIVYADGETGYITVRFFIVKDDTGRTVRTYGVNQDITERKRMEELQIQSERLRAVADLAGGVAHNFNNLLQIVIGNLELALMDLELGNYSEVKVGLEEVLESSLFGAGTVERLQSFAGIRTDCHLSEKKIFDLSDIVSQALEMSNTWWKSIPERQGIKISLDTDLQAGCLVRCEKNELFEVVVNLIRNATEALPQGGDIEVRVYIEGDRVVFRIRDTGIGISEENRRRLFNPFFTTKASAGSGLGLASSLKIVEGCGGDILVESSVGKGTTFTILLPLVQVPDEEPKSRKEVPGSGMNILVIDDVEAVQSVLRSGLAKSGHVVFTASSGQQGLDIMEDNEIDLVICDLGMSGMNGWEVGRRIRAACEKRQIVKTPFVLLTGWDGQKAEAEKIAESGVDAVIEKPVNIGNILKIVQDMGESE